MSVETEPEIEEQRKKLHANSFHLLTIHFQQGTLDRLLKGVKKLERMADEAIDNVQESHKVACSVGCWFCCAQRVRASVPEILLVAQHIREKWTPEEIEQLLGRIETYKARLADPSSQGVSASLRFICPLLKNQMCSVWEDRPLVCRGYGAKDAEPCEQRLLHPEKDIVVDTAKQQRALADGVRLGIHDAMLLARRGPDSCDLILGLDIALNAPNAGERFLRGESVFAGAIVR